MRSRILLLALALSSAACHELIVDGEPIRARHIVAGRGGVGGGGELTEAELFGRGTPFFGPSSGFVSTRADLLPLRNVLRDHVGLDFDILRNQAVGRPDALVTFLDLQTAQGAIILDAPVTGSSTTGPAATTLMVPALIDELNAIRPILALIGTTLPPVSNPSIDLMGGGAFFDRLGLRLAGGRPGISTSLEVFWDDPNPAIDGAAATEPVLVLRVAPNSDEQLTGIYPAFVVFDITGVELDIRIRPFVCALDPVDVARGLPPCVTASQRAGTYDGYNSDGNGAAPDVNLDLSVVSVGRSFSITQAVLPTCYLALGFIECNVLEGQLFSLEHRFQDSVPGSLGSIGTVVNALGIGLPPLLTTPACGSDLGPLPTTVAADATFPGFMSTLGAAGGLWGAGGVVGVSRGMTFTVPCLTTPTTVTASPNLAPVLSSLPYFASEMRGLFVEQILGQIEPPRGTVPRRRGTFARLNAITPAVDDAGAVAASFSFRLDRDLDGLEDRIDRCSGVSDVLDPTGAPIDTDGDRLPDVCDNCPGFSSLSTLDSDGDGIGDDCDCNREGDGCADRETDARYRESFPGECTGVAIPDRFYVDHQGLDTDGDGLPDDCDPDSDGDGILDAADNCPFVVNVDQTDSGASDAGDACDFLCPVPGALGCTIGSTAYFDPAEARFLPGGADAICLHDPSGCAGLIALDRCLHDGPNCDSLGILEFDPLTLRAVAVLGEQQIDVSDLRPTFAAIPDRDGDGIEELVVGSPRATACEGDVCYPRAGTVYALGSATGQVLFTLNGATRGARLGWSLVSLGDHLVVGAPGARTGGRGKDGAVFVYDLEWSVPRLTTTIQGETRGDKFGAALMAAGDRDGDGRSEFLVSAPGARTRAGVDAGRVYAYTFDGRRIATFDGTIARGRLGDDASVILARNQSPAGILVGARRAGSGGAVTFFDWSGAAVWVARGGRGDELGASLAPSVDFDADGLAEVAVGAPGARGGRGAVRIYTPFGAVVDQVSLPMGRRLGELLSVPGDLDRDGRAELAVSFVVGGRWQGMLLEGAGSKGDPVTPPWNP